MKMGGTPINLFILRPILAILPPNRLYLLAFLFFVQCLFAMSEVFYYPNLLVRNDRVIRYYYFTESVRQSFYKDIQEVQLTEAQQNEILKLDLPAIHARFCQDVADCKPYKFEITADGLLRVYYVGNNFNLHEKRNFSRNAQGRFFKVLDNFANLFESAYAINPNCLNVEWENVLHRRKPVFLTLTVPKQTLDDKEAKKQLLKPLLDNLQKNYGLKTYIWKAEAQARGAIHFHCTIDSFIHHDIARRLWFRLLQRNHCLVDQLTIKNASNIVHLNQIRNMETMKAELAGYFAANRDAEGRLVHKHDRNQRVRDITGNTWGCSDNLRYPPLTYENISMALEDRFMDNSLATIIKTHDETGLELAYTHIMRQSICVNDRTGERNEYVCIDNEPEDMKRARLLYHYSHAAAIYGGRSLTPSERDFLLKNSLFCINANTVH